MGDHHHHDEGQEGNSSSSPPSNRGAERSPEPVRSRWIPKPEQILILESIFNGGMVNPPKEETVRIRKVLEKFGSVGDANVFYWFQNRRSRSRRRQRQLQASLEQRNTNNQFAATSAAAAADGGGGHHQVGGGGAIQYGEYGGISSCSGGSSGGGGMGFGDYVLGSSSSSSSCGGHHHVIGGDHDHFFSSVSGQMGFPDIQQTSAVTPSPPHASNLLFQSVAGGVNNVMTVFINGIPTEVPKGPVDMKAMFGEDVILVHSSGLPLPLDEFGFLAHTLQPGESYFLVSRPS